MGYWRGLVGRGLSSSLPSFRRAAQRRSAPRLDEGSVPGMDFGAESTAMMQGGEYCGTWLRVGGGWLGVGFGFFRDRCRRLASWGGGERWKNHLWMLLLWLWSLYCNKVYYHFTSYAWEMHRKTVAVYTHEWTPYGVLSDTKNAYCHSV